MSTPLVSGSAVPKPSDIAVVRLEGALGRPGIEAADYLLREAAREKNKALLDLTFADEIDHRAVALLVARARVMRAQRQQLAVVAPPPVRQVLKAAGGELKVFSTLAEATAFLLEELAVATTGRLRPHPTP